MATELVPGAIMRVFTELAANAEARMPAALSAVALVVERQAKINASNGQHQYRTPTPARPGEGPARISGNLVRTITHTEPRRGAMGWEVMVGMAVGSFPFYDRRTPSNKYAYYLEVTGVGRDRVKFPFLAPAFDMAVRIQAVVIFQQVFGSGWASF